MSTAPAAEAPSAVAPIPTAFGRELWIVFRHEFRRLLFSLRSLVPMGIYAGFAALALWGFQFTEHKIDEQRSKLEMSDADFQKQKEDFLGKTMSTLDWGTEGDAAEIIRDHVPITIIIFFALASYFIPLLVAVVSFDQFSELSTRGARFALLRVRRETYVMGKAAAGIASVAAFLAVMWIVVTAVIAIRGKAEDIPVILREGVRAWALMSLFAVPYLSFTALISAFARPALAFVLTLAAWIGLRLGHGVIGTIIPWLLTKADLTTAADHEKKLLLIFPWEHAPKLISRDWVTLAQGAVGLIMIALVGYLATLYVVRRRDV